MASILVAPPACYLKIVLIPDDVRKGLILDQLENMGVSVPRKRMEKSNRKRSHLKVLHIHLLTGGQLNIEH